MTPDEALALAERVVRLCAGDADVRVREASEDLLRIANNQAIAHVSAAPVTIELGLRLDGRYGQASTQSAAPDDLAALVERAKAQAKLLPPEPDLLPSVGPQDLPAPAPAPAAVMAFDAAARAAAGEAMVAPVRAAGLVAAGICARRVTTQAMATTNGMRGAHQSAWLTCDLTALGDDSTGRAEAWVRDPAELDPAAVGASALAQAEGSRAPVALEPGTYRAVLSPAAVGSLLMYLGWGFNGRRALEGQTWVAGRQGEQVFDPAFSLRQAPAEPRLAACPFDGDGLAIQPVELIRDGVVGDLLHDRRSAAEAGATATGAGFGGRGAQGAVPAALVASEGTASRDELLAAVGDGVWVEHLWYTNMVDPRECVITGMTRDGLWRIRDGRLAEPLLNLRFNQSLLTALAEVLAVGPAQLRPGRLAGALAVGAWTFTSGTSF